VTKWNQILREKWYSQEEPDESVVNFVTLLKKKNKKLRVLDLGCGAGRHQVYMAKQGIEAHGADLSETGLQLTKERLRKQKLKVFLVKCDMGSLPYRDFCFDAVISLNAIYHQKLKRIQGTISEIHRILRKKGLLLVNFLSKRTHSHGEGAKVEENTFAQQEGIEKGVLHHFTDKEEIERLFRNFQIVYLELSEKEIEGKLRSRWILTAKA
jgi:ubiquinone/menaquinone biosynthesis C-methylase UbiE